VASQELPLVLLKCFNNLISDDKAVDNLNLWSHRGAGRLTKNYVQRT